MYTSFVDVTLNPVKSLTSIPELTKSITRAVKAPFTASLTLAPAGSFKDSNATAVPCVSPYTGVIESPLKSPNTFNTTLLYLATSALLAVVYEWPSFNNTLFCTMKPDAESLHQQDASVLLTSALSNESSTVFSPAFTMNTWLISTTA